tara:strand:- start:130 stop:294 length:165 start_codon:yes stop_codon:yes gene_type:complete
MNTVLATCPSGIDTIYAATANKRGHGSLISGILEFGLLEILKLTTYLRVKRILF